MEQSADFSLEDTDHGKRAVLTGDWTAVRMGEAPDRLAASLKGAPEATLDLTRVGRFDTSGAWGVLRAAKQTEDSERIIGSPQVKRLLALVGRAIGAEPTP